MLQCDHKALFIHYLNQLTCMVKKLEELEQGSSLLNKRLQEDMFPLGVQVKITANFALRACCNITGEKAVSYEHQEVTFETLFDQLNNSILHIQQMPDNQPYMDQVSSDKGGFKGLELPVCEYLFQFAIPNFFFHLSMVYAIARQHGIPLSKGDFDGYHYYPQGFSFE